MPELSPAAWSAIALSFKVAAVATLWGVPVATALALLLARGRFPGKALLDGLIHLPLVLPPVVTGYALLLLLGRKGPIGAFLDQQFGIVFAFRWTGAVVAAVVMALPIIVRAIRLSIEAVDVRLEQASGTLGAGRIATFFLVTLPLSLPGILAGATLGFAKALGEFGATITFVSNIPGETRTIASAIYTASQTPDGDAEALALSAVAAVLGLVALVASELLARRARGALS
jgi:molybdate transport system permease protein